MARQESFQVRSLPWVCMAFFLCYLVVLLSWQTQEDRQRQALLDWYTESGLLQMEWSHYLSWLRINGQPEKAESLQQARESGDTLTPFLDMAFNPRFEQENRGRGRDFWSPDQYSHWEEQRRAFHQRARALPRFNAGLVPTDPRPGAFITWHFLHNSLWHWALSLLVLLPFAWPLEARLGPGRTALLWLLGGVAAAWGPAVVFPDRYWPLVGSTAVVSALIGAFASLFVRERLPFLVFNPRARTFSRREWPAVVLLPLWFALPLYEYLRTGQTPAIWIAQLFGLAGGAVLAQLLRDAAVSDDEGLEENDTERERRLALAEGWNAMARFQFSDAERHFLRVLDERAEDFDALTGLVQVRRTRPSDELFRQSLDQLIAIRTDGPGQATQRIQLLRDLEKRGVLAELPPEAGLGAATALARGGAVREADNLVGAALDAGETGPRVAGAARALADALDKKGDSSRAAQWRKKADALMT